MATRARAEADAPFDAPNRTEQRRLERQARKDDQMLADIYDQGYTDGKADARTTGGARRRRRPKARSRRSLATGARAVLTPAADELSSGMQLLGATFGLLLLYLVLRNTTTATGVLSALRRGLDWLASPTASIPYRTT